MQAALLADVTAPGRFELRRRLGSGSSGVVYEAVERDSGATVALKTLHALGADALYRLKREFRLLQGLQHTNLCQLYELIEHQGRWFVSMELVRGQDFLSFVRPAGAGGGADLGRLRAAWTQLAEGLCALHDAHLVHRDIKPSNVLVTATGRVVVLDFGFVSDSDAVGPDSRTIVGTPAYMAPEQARSTTPAWSIATSSRPTSWSRRPAGWSCSTSASSPTAAATTPCAARPSSAPRPTWLPRS